MIKGFVSYWLNAGGREGFLAGTILLSAFIFCNSAFSASTSERSLDHPALSGIQLSEGPLKENEIHDFFIFPLPVADTSDTEAGEEDCCDDWNQRTKGNSVKHIPLDRTVLDIIRNRGQLKLNQSDKFLPQWSRLNKRMNLSLTAFLISSEDQSAFSYIEEFLYLLHNIPLLSLTQSCILPRSSFDLPLFLLV